MFPFITAAVHEARQSAATPRRLVTLPVGVPGKAVAVKLVKATNVPSENEREQSHMRSVFRRGWKAGAGARVDTIPNIEKRTGRIRG